MIPFACLPSPEHVDPSHPEHPRRLEGLAEAARRHFGESLEWIEPEAASETDILAVHPPEHLDFLRRACAQAPAIIDYAPTYVSPRSLEAALLAAGTTLAVVRASLAAGAVAGFAAIRPPGHHATADRAMGFCLLNNVAIAARAAQAGGLERVMIFDFDVHHGNGTQAIFEADPSVLYVSTHQHGIYPGSGFLEEIGVGDGRGFTVNIPLSPGAGDLTFSRVAEEVLAPLHKRFDPNLLLVSAGFDAHGQDPLAGLRLTTTGFYGLAKSLLDLSGLAGGPAVFVLEGGYHPAAVREGVLACLAAGLSVPMPEDELGTFDSPEPNFAPVLDRLKSIHRL